MSTIVLKQHPVIQHDLITVGMQVDERLTALNLANLVATDETISALKKLRAELNNEFKEFEKQRKTVKTLVMQPYADMEEVYKPQVSEKYKSGIDTLKTTIDEFETMVKDNKQAELEAYFTELLQAEGINIISFADTKLTINLSTSLKKYKEDLQAIVERTKADIEVIKTHAAADRLMLEYRKDFNISRATLEINNQLRAEREEKELAICHKIAKREQQLQLECNMLPDNFSKAWVEIVDNNIVVPMDVIREADDTLWESTIYGIKRQLEARRAISKAEQAVAAPLQAPTVVKETPTPQILTARFEVKGTFEQLKALQTYLKNNNYQFTDI